MVGADNSSLQAESWHTPVGFVRGLAINVVTGVILCRGSFI